MLETGINNLLKNHLLLNIIIIKKILFFINYLFRIFLLNRIKFLLIKKKLIKINK